MILFSSFRHAAGRLVRAVRPFPRVLAAGLTLLPMKAAAQSAQPPPVVGPGSVAGSKKITWQGVSGRVFFIQVSTDLVHWSYTPIVELGAGANLSWEFSTTGSRGYLRLRHSVDTAQTAGRLGDLDGDGLNNETEVTGTLTDPCSADTDLDGMADGWEFKYALNSLSAADASLDSDGDGMSNLLEFQLGAIPKGAGSLDSDKDGLTDAQEYNGGNGTSDPAQFDMPIISLMAWSREATLEDWREPSSTTNRHTWTDANAYRDTRGSGFNGSGTPKPAWLNPGPWKVANSLNPIGATNAFFDENPGALDWGTAQSTGSTLHAWLRQAWSWEAPYRVARIRARQIRYFLRSDRAMPMELKVRAIVTRHTRTGQLDAAWTAGGTAETNTLTLPLNGTESNIYTLNPADYPPTTPGATTDTHPRTVGDNYFTVTLREFPYAVTTSDSDGDGLPNTVEESMGTLGNNADTDGDGREDFLDFISTRPGTLAPTGSRTRPSSPTEEEEPVIEYVWRTGHVCPSSDFSKKTSDTGIAVEGGHWDFGTKLQAVSPAPTDPTVATKDFWTQSPAFPITLPAASAPPATALDESQDDGTVLRSFNMNTSYSSGGYSYKGGDSREALFRLRRETAGPNPVSQTFLIIDRQKTDLTASAWTYNSITPLTLTIEPNQPASPTVVPTANPLRLPAAVVPAAGKKSIREVLAQTLEIVDKDKKTANQLQVASLTDPFVLYNPPGSSTATLDSDEEPARFYVRIRGGAILVAVAPGAPVVSASCSLATEDNPTYLDDGGIIYNDDATEIDFETDGSDLITKSLILVSDHTDDDYKIQGITDDQKNDRSHLIRLGGNVAIKSVKIASTTYPITTPFKVPVPIRKTVTVNPVVMRRTPGGAVTIADAGVHTDLRVTRERYAQAGVDIKWNPIDHKDPPADPDTATRPNGQPMMDWFNNSSVNGPNEISRDVGFLFNARGTSSPDDIQIFYIWAFEKPTLRGIAFPPSYYPSWGKYQNNIIVSSVNKFKFTLSHELGHLLLNDENHHGDPSDLENFNLMKGGSVYLDDIKAPKRLLKLQNSAIIKNPLTK